jgi:hypothetical protein
MAERDEAKLWPTYALRAWLAALLGQLERAGADLDDRVDYHTKEIAHLRARKERSVTVITSLREAIGGVDNVLREERDTPSVKDRPKREADSEENAAKPRQPVRTPAARAASDHSTSAERGKT